MNFLEWLKITEMGVGPYIGNCTDTATYVVQGACSDQNSPKKNKAISHGNVQHPFVKTKSRNK